jgi:tRNA nucleotidyltransferase (CCA-adding enzyme)
MYLRPVQAEAELKESYLMSDTYLHQILARLRADTGPNSPARAVQATLQPSLLRWAGKYLVSMEPSGSFAKGTAIHGGTDIDIFASFQQTER